MTRILLFGESSMPSGNTLFALAFAAYVAIVAFFALMVWGIFRARTGITLTYMRLFLRGLVCGLIPPLIYAASENDDLVGKLAVALFMLGVPAVMIITAVRDIRKLNKS